MRQAGAERCCCGVGMRAPYTTRVRRRSLAGGGGSPLLGCPPDRQKNINLRLSMTARCVHAVS